MILVTGGTGRIGRHLVAVLAKKEKVRVMLRSSEEIPWKKVDVTEGDLLDKQSLRKAVQGCDTVYHLAAIVDYLAPKELMWNVNVEGTRNLVEAAHEAGVKKLVYLSSTAVYGKKHKNPADENTTLNPSNFYGLTKAKAEMAVISHCGTVIRSVNVFGKGFEEGYHTVFSMLKKGKMPLIGSGNNRIQYIHIQDLIQALLAARNAKGGDVFLVAGKEIKTQAELLQTCCKFLKCKTPKKHVPTWLMKMLVRVSALTNKLKGKSPKMIPEYIEKLAADRTFDTSKARAELGFQPKKTYEEGIAEMVEEYKRNK